MSSTIALIILLVATPYAVCAVRVVRAVRRGTLPRRGRVPFLAALGFLAAGGGAWALVWLDSETDLPWAWIVAFLLGVAAASAVARPGAVIARFLLITAFVAPVLAAIGMSAFYAFGSGVASGTGGTERYGSMLWTAIVVTTMAYTVPAVIVASLLRSSDEEQRTAARSG